MVPINFDLGIPALNLQVDGDVNIRLGFDVQFGFGVSKADGFYLDTSAENEMAVQFEVTIPNFDATGNLFFLQLEAKDHPATPSKFKGAFGIDLKDPSGDGKLTYGEFSGGVNFGDVIAAKLSATADVNLKTVVSFGGNTAFPTLRADLNLDLGFANFDTGDGTQPAGGIPHLAFNHIQLDFGTFISNFLKPIVGRIQDVLKPLKPVIDILTAAAAGPFGLVSTRALLDPE